MKCWKSVQNHTKIILSPERKWSRWYCTWQNSSTGMQVLSHSLLKVQMAAIRITCNVCSQWSPAKIWWSQYGWQSNKKIGPSKGNTGVAAKGMTWRPLACSQLLGFREEQEGTAWFEHNPVFPIFQVCAELPTPQINIEAKKMLCTYFYLHCPTHSSSIVSMQETWKWISGELLCMNYFSWSGYYSEFILKKGLFCPHAIAMVTKLAWA